MSEGGTGVRCEVGEHGVAVLTLDGPARLNAFSSRTARELGEAYRRCDADDAVRAVVLTGEGRAFCSGADLSDAGRSFGLPGPEFSASPVDPPAFGVRKLVVAAVNGPAIGIGLTLALQCDLRVVADDARLAVPQVRLGVMPDAQSHATLRRLAGTAVAADLLLTGRSFTGAEALALGVANRAVPAGDVLAVALEIARDVAVHVNPVSLALSKALLWSDLDLQATAVAETRGHHLLMGAADAVEGPRAWRERRPPRWQGRVSDLPGEPPEA